MVMTLDELKAKNAEDEMVEQEESAPIAVDVEDEAVKTDSQESDEVAEPNQNEGQEVEMEDWMQSDDQDDRKFTDYDVAAAKRKFRAKLEKKHNEALSEKEAEIERLRAQLSGGGSQPVMQRPTREQFDYDDDRYEQALQDYLLSKAESTVDAKLATTSRQHQEAEQKRNIEQRVDQHYERVAKLSQEANIQPEVYQAADLKVRQMIDRVLPNQGDMVTDNLIARLGEGSEKAIFFLGRNPAAQNEFENKLRSDPTGLDAAMYMGELKSRFNSPKSRVSNAPKPPKSINGDAQSGDLSSQLKRKYEKAGSDIQKRIDVKREAKAQGVDTKSW